MGLRGESLNMHRRSACQVGFLALATVLTISIVSCATTPAGPVVALPNGYYLRPDPSDRSVIVRRGGERVLPDTVAAYAVSGYLVAGALGQVPPSLRPFTDDLPFTGGATTRYFIVDTTSGKVESNLDAATWHARLKALGVPSDFEIYPPLPWQQ